jgi:peptide/nickel transport system permease protein
MSQTLAKLLLSRLLQAGLVAWAVGTLTFLLTRALPGDMAYRIVAGRYGYEYVDRDAAQAVADELALNSHALSAYLHWLWELLQGNLGHSLVSGEPVWQELGHQLGHSLDLALIAVLMALLIGPPLGMLAGLRQGRALDRLSLVVAIGLRSLPSFVIGLLLIMLFSVTLGWLPAAGHGTSAHLWLPALSLALGLAAVSARVSRHAMARVANAPFYAFAMTKGLSPTRTFWQHGLRNVGVPVVAYLGVQLVYLIEGVVVVESLFAWPGIGHALVHALVARDVPMVQGTALAMGLLFVALNALVDLACLAIDPRRRPA